PRGDVAGVACVSGGAAARGGGSRGAAGAGRGHPGAPLLVFSRGGLRGHGGPPRLVRVVAGGGGGGVGLRGGPGALAARWLGSEEGPPPGTVPPTGRSLAVAAKIALDEVFFLTEVLTAQLVSPGERHRLRAEAAEGVDFFESRGFLADPSAYHLRPL